MIAIGEAARQSGVSIETIRYYEREGIVPRPARAENGRRLYAPQDVQRLRFIRRCRDLGFTMAGARALMALSEGREADCALARSITLEHLGEVRRRIADLRRLESSLLRFSEQCKGGKTRCPLIDSLCAG